MKNIKNLNEEINRIKQMFDDQRLYGNIINEAGITKKLTSYFDDIKKINDDFINNTKTLKNYNTDEIIKNLKTNLDEFLFKYNKLLNNTKINIKNSDDVLKLFGSTDETGNFTNGSITNYLNEEFRKLIISIDPKPLGKKFKDQEKQFNNYKTSLINSFNSKNSELNKTIYSKLKESKNAGYLNDDLKNEINNIYEGLGDKIKPFLTTGVKQLYETLKIIIKKIYEYIKIFIDRFFGISEYYNNLKNIIEKFSKKNKVDKNSSEIDKKTIYQKLLKIVSEGILFLIRKTFAYYFFEQFIYCKFFYRESYKNNYDVKTNEKNNYVSSSQDEMSTIINIINHILYEFKFSCKKEGEEGYQKRVFKHISDGLISYLKRIFPDEEINQIETKVVDLTDKVIQTDKPKYEEIANNLSDTLNNAYKTITPLLNGKKIDEVLSKEQIDSLYNIGI